VEIIEEAPQIPGSKTDPDLLLKSLQDEREKRRKEQEERIRLEEELKSYKTSNETVAFSDEGKLLEQKMNSMLSEFSEMKTELSKKDLIINYPILKEKWSEFEEFRTDNKGMNIKTAAKAFLTENGLLEPKRVGLEKSNGGARTPTPTNMTSDEIKNLRTTNFKKYQELLKKGQIKI